VKHKVIQRQKCHVRRGDIVMAIAGEDADGKKSGKVLQVFPKTGRAIVEGFNYVKKHLRKSKDHPQGGIIEKEAPIHVSNLKVVKRHEEHGAGSEKK
jgi:large subunit ribosomal protein L24